MVTVVVVILLLTTKSHTKVTEVCLSLYKYFSKPRYKEHSDTDKVYVYKKGATILGWYPVVFEHDSTKVSTHVSHKILWKPDAKRIQHKVRKIPLAV